MSKKIFHLQKGKGPYQFALIHNAGGNHQFLQKTFHFLSQRGLALTLDLPGHGKSDLRVDGDYSIAAHAKSVRTLLENRKQKWILIGLNYGANVAIELNFQYPDLVSHLILIDPPILIQPRTRKMIEDHIEELRTLSPHEYAKHLVSQTMLKATKSAVQIAESSFSKISREVLIAVYQQLFVWDQRATSRLQSIQQPTLDILTSQPFCKDLGKYIPHMIQGQVVSSGPWATLEVPTQVNVMIDRFLKTSVN